MSAENLPWGAPRIHGELLTRRLRAMGIRDKPIAPASPWQARSRRKGVDHGSCGTDLVPPAPLDFVEGAVGIAQHGFKARVIPRSELPTTACCRSDNECRSAPPWCRHAAFGRPPVRARPPPA